MKSTIFDETHFVRLVKGEEIVATLRDYCKEHQITAGKLNAIGAARDITIAYFDPDGNQYQRKLFAGSFEVTSLMGSITLKDGEPHLHLHINISDADHHVYGGHLDSGTISVTGEVIIEKYAGTLKRSFDSETNLFLWDI